MVAVWWIMILPLWLWLSPAYGHLLALASNVAFHANPLNHDEIIFAAQDRCIKSDIYFDVTKVATGEEGRGHLKFSVDAERFHFNLTIWLALMLATPFEGNRGRKLLWLVGGTLIMLCGQSLDLFLQTQDDKLTNFERLLETADGLRSLPPVDHVLSWAGRYFLLAGSVVLPLVIWMTAGVPRIKSAQSEETKPAKVPSQSSSTA
jgi:hypothetical protein